MCHPPIVDLVRFDPLKMRSVTNPGRLSRDAIVEVMAVWAMDTASNGSFAVIRGHDVLSVGPGNSAVERPPYIEPGVV